MKKNQLKPSIRFKDFTEDWEQRELGKIVKITMGTSPDGSTYSNEPRDYILVQGNADLKDGWVEPRIWTTKVTKMAEAGDLIMSVRAPAGAMGKTAYNAVIGRGVAAIKGNEFIFQSLVKMDIEGFWKKLSAGSTFDSLNTNVINEANIYIPKIKEQDLIGGFLNNIDSLITLHQRKYDKLSTVKQSLLRKMFPNEHEKQPLIRFKGFTEDWEQRKFGEFGSCKSGVGFPEKEQGGEIGLPFFKVSDMNTEGNERILNKSNNYVTLNQVKNNNWNIAYSPAIFFAKVGAAVLLDRKRLILSDFFLDNNTMYYPINKSYWDINFCFSTFERTYLPSLIQVGALPSYNGNQVDDIDIYIPKKAEQEKIGQLFLNIDNLITLHQRKLELLKNIKKSLLKEMFPN